MPAFVSYMAARANYLTPNTSVDRLLTPQAASQAGRGSLDSLTELMSTVPLDPAESCGYLYLHEHHRRYTVPSLELFRSRIDVRLPFVDPEFLQVLLSAPPRWRDDTSIHRALVAGGNAALLRVRNSNTGAAADASPLVESVMDKVNTLSQTLERPRLPALPQFRRVDAAHADQVGPGRTDVPDVAHSRMVPGGRVEAPD